jgi:hypothetical protein
MQKVDLYQPLLHNKNERPPLVLRVGVNTTTALVEGGTPEVSVKPETYVLLSALPRELQERVRTAVQALISDM